MAWARPWALATVAVVAIATLTSCSGDDDPAAAGSTTTTVAPASEDVALQALVDRIVEVGDVPGAVLAVRHDGETWVGAAGLASTDPEEPMAADAVIPVASVTKSFVAALVLQEVDAGTIALEDPLSTWVPDWADAGAITIEHLLRHTTGIPDYMDVPELRDLLLADLERAWTPQETVDLVREVPPLFAPGDFHSYSNTNYLLLGIILESVTGSSLADLIAERLTAPLALDDTKLDDGAGPFDARSPHLYYDLAGDGTYVDVHGFPRRAAFTTKWAEGGMVSTASDLVEWAEALWGGDEVVADAALHDAMVDVTEYGYGYGTQGTCPCSGAPLDRVRYTGYGHQGDFYGSRAIVVHWPTSDVSVAILINQSPVSGLILDEAAQEARTIVGGPAEGF